MISTKKLAKTAFRRAGLDVRHHHPATDPLHLRSQAFASFGIDVVFDIGANTGQFGQELRDCGYTGRIISFEPLSSAHAQLSQAAHNDPAWTVAPRSAVGDQVGTIEINISGNSVSSSILPMKDLHTSASATSAYRGREETAITTVDAVAGDYLRESDTLLLKIDTQGFEWQVLDGAAATLKRTKAVLCELSLVPLYEGQRLWGDLMARLEAEGFTFWSMERGFTDPRNGRLLQVDGLFVRA